MSRGSAMDTHFDFYPLLVVSILAVLVPVIVHRIPGIRVPIIVGEIVAGILVGPDLLGFIGRDPDPWLDFLRLFGFAYLMFLSGLEIDFGLLLRKVDGRAGGRLRSAVGGPLRAGLLCFAVTLIGALGCSVWVVRADLAGDVIVMALVLSTTSLGVVAPVLKERGLTGAPLGQYTLVAAVVGDFATVSLVSVYVILHTQGLTFELLFVLVLLAATILVYRLADAFQRHLPLESLFAELSHATAQLDTRGALALAVIFIALAQGLGLEVILGAFMAGAIVSLLSAEEGSVLRPKLNALGYGFFIPIFFILVGADLKLSALATPRGWLLIPALIVAAYAVKYLAAIVYRTIFSWRETLALGTLISCRLSLIIAVSAIGVEIGAIGETTNAAIVLVAIFSVIASPIAFNRMIPHAPGARRERIIVAGSTPHAQLLARRLNDHGERVTVLTGNRHLHQEIADMGVEVVLARPGGQVEHLPEAGVADAKAVVTMLDDEEQSLRLGTMAKERFGIANVVALVGNPEIAAEFEKRGMQVVDPGMSAVVVAEGLIRHPHAFSLVTRTHMARHMIDVRLGNPRLENQPLHKVPLPGDALVLLIVREDQVVFPRGGTRLLHGDLLTVVGSPDAVESAREHLSG